MKTTELYLEQVLIGFLIGPAILMLTALWLIYRIIRGWLALRDRRPVGG